MTSPGLFRWTQEDRARETDEHQQECQSVEEEKAERMTGILDPLGEIGGRQVSDLEQDDNSHRGSATVARIRAAPRRRYIAPPRIPAARRIGQVVWSWRAIASGSADGSGGWARWSLSI